MVSVGGIAAEVVSSGSVIPISEKERGQSRTYKLIVVGDSQVGKTSLIRAQAGMLFRPEYIATIGADVITRIYKLGNQNLFLLIFDIRGDNMYDSVNDYFFSGASAALVVFDLTRKETYRHVGDWHTEVRRRIPFKIPTMLLGNKADLEQERMIKYEVAKQASMDLGVNHYLETSAKTTANVDKAFMEILARCLIEGPKDSSLKGEVEDVVRDIHPADHEIVEEIKKLDDIGRKATDQNDVF